MALYGQCRTGAQINFPESRRGLGHVTPTIFGSMVGYPSDSLASCLSVQLHQIDIYVWHCTLFVVLARNNDDEYTNYGLVCDCTLCSEKNTHSHFVSYLYELFVDLNKHAVNIPKD